MTENQLILEYVKNNKRLFSLHNIDTIRDGGTIVLESYTHNRVKYYIDKDNYTLHSDYPTDKLNEVTDDLTKAYIFHCIEKYKQRKEAEVERIIKIMYNISNPK